MLEINSKQDIIVPFVQLGDQQWQEKSHFILDSYADNFYQELPQPINESEIIQLQQRLGTTLPNGLKLFYQTFGIADIGEQLLDFDHIHWLKSTWQNAPEYAPDFSEKDLQVLPYLVSFSDYLGNGNQFCFHSETKEIYYFDHDTKPLISKMFGHVDDYLKGCLIFAQSELFDDVDQEQVEIWCEEIVIGLFGEEIVKKWRY